MFEEGKIWSVEENNEERKGGKYHVKGKIVADGWANIKGSMRGPCRPKKYVSNLSEHQPQRKLPTIRPNM